MKLYYGKGSCSLASHIVLYELGLNFSAIAVDLKTKTFEGGDFNKLNSKGYVPVLELDSGEKLTEGVVILQYLADQKPDSKLAPSPTSFDRYRMQEWLNYIATEVHKNFSPLWNSKMPEAAKALATETLNARFQYLNTHLSKQDYLFNNSFSIADAYLFTVLNWTRFLKISLQAWPALDPYMKRISERASVREALIAEGILKAA